ncbi:MAG: hypothetical protein JSU85_06515, partial [Candidatus Zixiibacteriota bacterium]
MSLPNVNEVIKDGGLGVISAASAGVFGIEGNASMGTVETPYAIGDPATAEDTFEAGTLLERILDAFANGAIRIIAVRTDATGGTATDKGTPTADTGNTSTGTVDTTGTPKNDRDIKLVITDGGVDGSLAAGGVKIKISKNGGLSYEDEISLGASSPQSVDLGNGTGVTLTDNVTPAGSFVENDFWTWSCTEAKPTTQKKLDAIEKLAENNEISWIHVTDATDETFWASLSTLNATIKAGHKYIWFLAESDRPSGAETTAEWVTSLETASASFFDSDVCISAGWGLLTDKNGDSLIRNGAAIMSGLFAGADVNECIGHVGGFKINNMLSLYPTDLTEALIESLDVARYATFRFWPGHGYRVTDDRAMASLTSDFQRVRHTRTLYKAVKLARTAALPFVNAVASESGLIALQKACETPLDRMKSDGEIEGYTVVIPAGQD